jgi:hypothetical protein
MDLEKKASHEAVKPPCVFHSLRVCTPWCGHTNTKTGRADASSATRSRDLFVVYTDRKLLTPATIAHIETQFHLPAERTEVQSDGHYQSTETPNGLGT